MSDLSGNDVSLADLAAISESTTREELLASVLRAAQRYDFPLVSVTCVADPGNGAQRKFLDIRNAPDGYDAVVSDPERALRDPSVQRAKNGPPVPFTYDRSTYVEAGVEDLWEAQAAFGYRTGIATCIKLDKGRTVLFGMDREAPLPTAAEELTELLAYTQLVGTFVQDAALRLLTPETYRAAAPVALTQRERECLQWASAGKTAWETSRILGISESSVNKHCASAARRLGCSSKAQAIAKAFALGAL